MFFSYPIICSGPFIHIFRMFFQSRSLGQVLEGPCADLASNGWSVRYIVVNGTEFGLTVRISARYEFIRLAMRNSVDGTELIQLRCGIRYGTVQNGINSVNGTEFG